MPETIKNSLDPEEVARFSEICSQWWDENGPFKPLHHLNPTRLKFIRDAILSHTHKSKDISPIFQGLSIVDIGCGGGLVAEPLTRLGARVTGVDASEKTIEVARAHAALMGLDIDYRAAMVEDLAAAGEKFDVVLALEIVEHVADVKGFLQSCHQVLKPGGLLILSTLNRTLKAYMIGIVGAEYVMRWLPVGTHQWEKFLRPSELAGHLREMGLEVKDLKGMSFNPLKWEWSLGPDLDVNYFILAA